MPQVNFAEILQKLLRKSGTWATAGACAASIVIPEHLMDHCQPKVVLSVRTAGKQCINITYLRRIGKAMASMLNLLLQDDVVQDRLRRSAHAQRLPVQIPSGDMAPDWAITKQDTTDLNPEDIVLHMICFSLLQGHEDGWEKQVSQTGQGSLSIPGQGILSIRGQGRAGQDRRLSMQ